MRFSVKVIVNAKTSEVVEDGTDLFESRYLKIKVNKPPEDGKANKEVIRVIADYLQVKTRDVRIIKGETSTSKIVKVVGLERSL